MQLGSRPGGFPFAALVVCGDRAAGTPGALQISNRVSGPANSLMPANVFLAAPRDHTAEAERELERVLTLGARGRSNLSWHEPFCSWRRCALAGYWCSCAHYKQKFYRWL
jgi:hypothetical protein